jgi:hypothetical protein
VADGVDEFIHRLAGVNEASCRQPAAAWGGLTADAVALLRERTDS